MRKHSHHAISTPTNLTKLEQLWVALLEALKVAMSASKVPTGELLSIVRLFVRDNQSKPNAVQVKQLQDLYTALVNRFVLVMNSEEGPTPSQMESIRKFLADQSVSKDADIQISLENLSSLSLPFH